MSGLAIALVSVPALVLLIWGGLHVPTAMIVVSLSGVLALTGDAGRALAMAGIAAGDAVASYELGVVPLFVLMGLLVLRAGMGSDAYAVAFQVLRGLPGGLAHATVAANAIFAAITGVSVASATLFTKLSVPEMVRYGYDERLAVGVVAGSSVLGMLIPPSVLMIIYGLLTNASIGDLFIAGVVPGVLLAAAYSLYIAWCARHRPEKVGVGAHERLRAEAARMSVAEMAQRTVPLALMIGLVLGGMYAGLFTATEAAAIGATLALLLAVARRRLPGADFWAVLVETGQVTASLLVLILAASIYSRFLALTGLPSTFGSWVAGVGLSLGPLLLAFVVVLLLLGTLMDSASIMLITVPLFLPLFNAMNVDLVWLGIVTVIAVEVGLLTPPFGMGVFVVKGSLANSRLTVKDVFAGAWPFAGVMIAVLALVMLVPGIATGLVAAAR
jgi:tripartite ATP-independent transporter DctM subunit